MNPIEPTYPNRVQLSKIMHNAQQLRMVVNGCLENLAPDETLHYELGVVEPGPDLEKRLRLGHFLQMTLPGKPVLLNFDDFSTTESEFNPDNLERMVDYLAVLRGSGAALVDGDYYPLNLEQPDVFGFVRETEMQRIVVMVNCSERNLRLHAPALTGEWAAGTNLVTGSGERPGEEIELARFEGKLFETRRAWA